MSDIDWTTWVPVDPATLVFIVRGHETLLIRKKRGLGAGKISAPGGRIEAGESALEAAIREVEEELRVTPLHIDAAGQLRFQFVDGYSLHVHVFRADGLAGKPTETEEAVPLWTALDSIPYDEMWEDDALWVPMLIDRRPFSGRFTFDGDRMLDHRLAVTGTPRET